MHGNFNREREKHLSPAWKIIQAIKQRCKRHNHNRPLFFDQGEQPRRRTYARVLRLVSIWADESLGAPVPDTSSELSVDLGRAVFDQISLLTKATDQDQAPNLTLLLVGLLALTHPTDIVLEDGGCMYP